MSPGRGLPLRRIHVRLPRQSLRERMLAVRHRWRLLVRLSIATSLAYFVSTRLLGHEQAFFAPVAAIIVSIAGVGLRARTLFELVIGVALGVLVGELLILTIGRGVWQMALVVVLTVVLSTLVGLKGLALTQAANSSVLLAVIIPAAGASDPAVTRFLDALVGGVAGLAMVLLLPRNAVRDIDDEVQSILTRLADVLGLTARALRENDAGLADTALDDSRAMQPQIESMESTAANVTEIARMSPMRWSQREQVEVYVSTIHDLDNAVRDARVLARRVGSMLRHAERGAPDMHLAVDALAEAVRIFADELSERDDFDRARQQLVEAARIAVAALPGAMTMNSAAIAAQVRSLAADLLFASGARRDEIDDRLDFD